MIDGTLTLPPESTCIHIHSWTFSKSLVNHLESDIGVKIKSPTRSMCSGYNRQHAWPKAMVIQSKAKKKNSKTSDQFSSITKQQIKGTCWQLIFPQIVSRESCIYSTKKAHLLYRSYGWLKNNSCSKCQSYIRFKRWNKISSQNQVIVSDKLIDHSFSRPSKPMDKLLCCKAGNQEKIIEIYNGTSNKISGQIGDELLFCPAQSVFTHAHLYRLFRSRL